MRDDTAITYGARLAQLAAERGNATAVQFLAADGSEEAISWATLDESVNRIARALAKRGVTEGDVVAFGLANTPAHLTVALAIWRLGATTMVLDPSLPESTADALCRRIGARLRLHRRPGCGDLSLDTLERLAAEQSDAPLEDRVSRPGKIVMSGGSTGLPKLMADDRPFVRVPGKSWGKVAPALGFRADQVQLVCGAMSHNAPFTWAQNGLFEGNTLVLMERFDAGRALAAIDRFAVGFAMLVPTMMVRMSAQLPASGASLESLHSFYHTAAPCPIWLKRAWIERLGPERVFEMYGSGENTGQTVISGPEWLSHEGSVGRGFETKIRIRDEAGGLLEPGEIGEIFMRPDDLDSRSRYVGPDAPPPRADADGFQSIGDTGWLDSDGYLYLTGRRDDVINTGGVKVNPERVEAELMRHPEIADAVVFGAEDREWGQSVVALISLMPGATLTAEAVRSVCSQGLTRPEIPKHVEIVASLPRDGFGKIRRRALKADYASAVAASRS
ncbi:AMP-binding protein [Jiella sonneratiae]|uniref:AMP-binding protein n=1 Tax=Jiella sonneratiae TaxID=2816856 RepID=A0ABS3JA11_9HYPH|nr:AMP-binding protein [Jiella sonneratiae]MBO0906510.1 AMP-binding protein [Jiella sonneratiae]